MEAHRRKLPVVREGITHRFSVGMGEQELTVYIQTGQYGDGALGEVFLKADKQGSLVSGLVESLSVVISLALQYGMPLEVIVDKLKSTRFDPAGRVSYGGETPKICTSIVDYMVRWLEQHYKKEEQNVPEQ